MALEQERSQREMETRERAKEKSVAEERIAPGAQGAPRCRQDQRPAQRNQREKQPMEIPLTDERIARSARGATAAELHLIPPQRAALVTETSRDLPKGGVIESQ